jgi:lipoprotein-anchoring transpeptidase ErfK/SrfK
MEAPGTIIISTAERHFYVVQGNGRAHADRRFDAPATSAVSGDRLASCQIDHWL